MPEVASELCRSCGICCDGSLYGSVPLEHEEVARAPALRLQLLRTDPEPAVMLPCACHTGNSCGIYASRPSCCARYACDLLLRLESGAIDAAEAHRQVRTAKSLIGNLRARLPREEHGFSVWRALRRYEAAARTLEDAACRRLHGELLLDAAQLAVVLRKAFDSKFLVPEERTDGHPASTPDAASRGQ